MLPSLTESKQKKNAIRLFRKKKQKEKGKTTPAIRRSTDADWRSSFDRASRRRRLPLRTADAGFRQLFRRPSTGLYVVGVLVISNFWCFFFCSPLWSTSILTSFFFLFISFLSLDRRRRRRRRRRRQIATLTPPIDPHLAATQSPSPNPFRRQ